MPSGAPGAASALPVGARGRDSRREPLGSRRRWLCSSRAPPSLLHVTLVGGPAATVPRLQSSTASCSGPRTTCAGPGPQLSSTVVSWGNGSSPAKRRGHQGHQCVSSPRPQAPAPEPPTHPGPGANGGERGLTGRLESGSWLCPLTNCDFGQTLHFPVPTFPSCSMSPPTKIHSS